MRVIVAGSRDIQSQAQVVKAIDTSGFEITTLVSGGARGVDQIAEGVARIRGIPIERYEPDWDTYGKQAGPIRNVKMAENADALIAVWDGESKGTRHMIHAARVRGLRVIAFLARDDGSVMPLWHF